MTTVKGAWSAVFESPLIRGKVKTSRTSASAMQTNLVDDLDPTEKAARDTVIRDLGITLPQLYTILQESNFRYETSLLTERQKRFWGWSIKK